VTWRDFSPLRLDNKGLPPALVMAARIMAAALVLRGDSTFRLNIPYVELLDHLLPPDTFNLTLRLAADAGYLLILFSPFVRTGSGVTGVAYLVGLLACRPCHSVAHTYVACLLIIIALSSRATGTWLLRAQVVILYAGAALNKTLDVDWWNGRYFDAFLIDHHANAVYAWSASLLPTSVLSAAMGILTIVTQWVLVAAFLRPRWTPAGIAVGLVFHGVMVVLLNNTFGPFMLALFATYVGLATWPTVMGDSPRPGGELADRLTWLWHQPAWLFLLTALLASAALSGWVRNLAMIAAAMSLLPPARRLLLRT
jgi:hypothetical protein